jgi:alkylhydroperoxidase family enzyme
MLSNDEAWRKLPGATAEVQPLPGWARMLAGPMPKTTAAMLELDAHHRTGDRLPAVLRGKIRWAAADANQCEYAKAVAVADLRRAGLTDGDLAGLAAGRTTDEAERVALDFARKMMRDANTVSDEDVKKLIGQYGEQKVVAIVTLIAHAAFQDRLLLALKVPAEEKQSLPLSAKFARTRSPAGPPPQPPPGFKPVLPEEGKGAAVADKEWTNKTYSDLQRGLGGQKDRVSRIRIPDWSEVGPRLPEESWGHRLPRVYWNRVAYAHQPEASDLWFDCVDQFRQESKMDRVLQQYVFWIVTRSIDCFY